MSPQPNGTGDPAVPWDEDWEDDDLLEAPEDLVIEDEGDPQDDEDLDDEDELLAPPDLTRPLRPEEDEDRVPPSEDDDLDDLDDLLERGDGEWERWPSHQDEDAEDRPEDGDSGTG